MHLFCFFNLFQSWPSPVSTLEGEVAQLRLELKKSEGNRLQLLAQLREYQAIGLERGVSASACMRM